MNVIVKHNQKVEAELNGWIQDNMKALTKLLSLLNEFVNRFTDRKV